MAVKSVRDRVQIQEVRGTCPTCNLRPLFPCLLGKLQIKLNNQIAHEFKSEVTQIIAKEAIFVHFRPI